MFNKGGIIFKSPSHAGPVRKTEISNSGTHTELRRLASVRQSETAHESQVRRREKRKFAWMDRSGGQSDGDVS